MSSRRDKVQAAFDEVARIRLDEKLSIKANVRRQNPVDDEVRRVFAIPEEDER